MNIPSVRSAMGIKTTNPMEIEQRKWTPVSGWAVTRQAVFSGSPQLIFAFIARNLADDIQRFEDIKAMYPGSHIVSCSTSGEIADVEVSDDTISLIAVYFERSTVQCAQTVVADAAHSQEAGRILAGSIPRDGLSHVLLFSEGVHIDGSALLRGISEVFHGSVPITGGLAGDVSTVDDTAFGSTRVGLDTSPGSGTVVAIGFYGSALKIGHGSVGGWDTFGPERLVTRSKGSTLYEIDKHPALQLYKDYLGDRAKRLPAAGLLFPISVRTVDQSGAERQIIRTFYSVNENEQSMTFVGDVPEGAYVKLMRANFEHLIDAAADAAEQSMEHLGGAPDLAILTSCIGRKIVLKERTEEEIEATRSVFDTGTAIGGFYTYGEICPATTAEADPQLYNQTMTITTFREE